jgi:hypothetical protein
MLIGLHSLAGIVYRSGLESHGSARKSLEKSFAQVAYLHVAVKRQFISKQDLLNGENLRQVGHASIF